MTVLLLDAQFNELASGVLIRMTPEGTTKVTAHPTENSADINDHAQAMNETARVVMGVSDVALGQPVQHGRTEQVYDALEQLRRNPQIISVVTARRSIDQCIITRVSAPYDAKSGNGALIEFTVEEVRTTQASNVDVPANVLAAARRASGKSKNKKQDSTRKETDKEKKARGKTILKGLVDAVGGK